MPRKSISLLDRAEGDLKAAKQLIKMDKDDVVVDICAYHCQQCVEKTVKFLILLEGKEYVVDHRSDEYLEDLDDPEVKAIVESIAYRIDAWATTIRYHHSAVSNKKAVEEIIAVCERLVSIAKAHLPKESETQGLVGVNLKRR
jgi:HEPN domain-containing protein